LRISYLSCLKLLTIIYHSWCWIYLCRFATTYIEFFFISITKPLLVCSMVWQLLHRFPCLQ
jgi:hypothetical protein